jgi:hypothetical protein
VSLEFTERDTLLAARIGCTPVQVAPHVLILLQHNVIAKPEDIPKIEKEMGTLKTGMTAFDYEDFFIKLCTGLQYIAEKTRVVIPNISIQNALVGDKQFEGGIFYYQPNHTLVIQPWFIQQYVTDKKHGIRRINEYLPGIRLTAEDYATVGGVEEGYHAYQSLDPKKSAEIKAKEQAQLDPLIEQAKKAYPAAELKGLNEVELKVKIRPELKKLIDQRILAGTWKSFWELDAVPTKRQAMKDLKLGPHRVSEIAG